MSVRYGHGAQVPLQHVLAALGRRATTQATLGTRQHAAAINQEVSHPYPEFAEFSTEQINLLREMFEHGAKTRDGLLDHHELSQITHFWGTGLSPSDAREIIIQIDSDADGRISFRDFLALWRRANEGDVPLRVRSNLKRTVTQLGLEPRAEKPERLRFAGARGFFEQGMKKHARDCNDN